MESDVALEGGNISQPTATAYTHPVNQKAPDIT